MLKQRRDLAILIIAAIILVMVTTLHQCGSHHYVVNYDAFYFHYLAGLIMQGEAVPWLGSGLAYPLAWLGDIIGLRAASVILPVLLGVLTLVIVHWGVSRMYGVRAGMLAALCLAFAQIPRLLFLSGNVDRDCLHMPLIATGMFALGLWLHEGRWGWLMLTVAAGLALVAEWGWFAIVQYVPLIMLVLLLAHFHERRPWFYLIVVGLALLAFVLGRLAMARSVFSSTDIAELQPLFPSVLIQFATLLIPMIAGWQRSGAFELSWFCGGMILGCLASRLAIYAAIPACIIAAHGLMELWGRRHALRYAVVGIWLVYLGFSWIVPRNMIMPSDWHEALVWIRENTPQEAVIGTWWSYGYWVQDVAERMPLATDATQEVVPAIARGYASGPSELPCDYFIMSTWETNFRDTIERHASMPLTFYDGVLASKAPEASIVYRNGSVTVIKCPPAGPKSSKSGS